MIKYLILILCVIAMASITATSPQNRAPAAKRLQSDEQDSVDDLEEGANKDDLKSSASHGYGYYGYPFGGIYSSYPYSYSHYGGYGGYYGGFYPYSGGYGFHGHYF